MHLQKVSTVSYNGFPKLSSAWLLEKQKNHVLSYLAQATLQYDNDKSNFQFQILLKKGDPVNCSKSQWVDYVKQQQAFKTKSLKLISRSLGTSFNSNSLKQLLF